MAAHKGYAIAFVKHILSAVLSGSKSGRGIHGSYETDKPGGRGHVVLAIDVKRLGSPRMIPAGPFFAGGGATYPASH